MRVRLLASLLLGATLMMPTAHAARASLALDGPDETLTLSHEGVTRTSLVVTLRMSGFACSGDETFPMRLGVAGPVGAELENRTLTFLVPSGAYVVDGFEAEAPVMLTLWPGETVGAVQVRVSALLAHAPTNCVSPGPFPETTAEATLRVVVPEPPEGSTQAPMPPAEPVPEETVTPGELPEESTAAPDATQTPTPSPSGAPFRDPAHDFPPGGGWIGDYDARAQGEGAVLNATPGLHAVGIALAVGVATLLARRKA